VDSAMASSQSRFMTCKHSLSKKNLYYSENEKNMRSFFYFNLLSHGSREKYQYMTYLLNYASTVCDAAFAKSTVM
jgi:hypothetical protein